MNFHRTSLLAAIVIAVAICLLLVAAQPASTSDLISIGVNRPGAAVSPGMFGIFFEDINFAADGGLYPELVKNRSFEFTEPLNSWNRINVLTDAGELIVNEEGGLNPDNPHYLRVRTFRDASGLAISNGGFRGMGLRAGSEYVLSAYVRAPAGTYGKIRASVSEDGGREVAETVLSSFGREWKRYDAIIRPNVTVQHGRLNLFFDDKGDVDIDMVSLYPKDTWAGRKNGLRKDLVQLLADMKPGFVRFPGGCIVEGRRLALRYQWKKTVGDVAERRAIVNRWNDEFSHRPAPDYFQSFGLGFFEYFQLAEDIGASPLPILNCGMACQFNSSELAALDTVDRYVQDALDLVEFANGSTDTRWGALRAGMGHPAPFNLKTIGVGNEQWGPQYIERYRRFSDALKAKYPTIEIVAAAGPAPSGKEFEYAWNNFRNLKADYVDEHYYAAPQWFLQNAGRYDKYDRNGPKVFAGEYAAQTVGIARPENRNNWEAALAEAAFMTGLERNADVVRMASYAPLLAHVDAWQWTPDLIWFDNLRSYGTPNYYVQKLYATNVGKRIVPIAVNGSPSNGAGGVYTTAAIDEKSGEVIFKAVNTTDQARPVRVRLDGARRLQGQARLTTLGTTDLKAENTLEEPKRVAPADTLLAPADNQLSLTLSPRSMTVLRAKYVR